MMSDPKKLRKQRKSREPLEIQDLELNKETVADLTAAEAEHVKGGMFDAEVEIPAGASKHSGKRICCN